MITLFTLLFPVFNYNNWEIVWSVLFVRLTNSSCLELKHPEITLVRPHLDEECSPVFSHQMFPVDKVFILQIAIKKKKQKQPQNQSSKYH